MPGQAPRYQHFFAELKRRRVFRVMAVYGIVGFVLLQIVDLAVPALLLPDWTYRLVALILLLGFPVTIVLAWAFEMTPEGVRRTAEAGPGELSEIIAAPAARRWPSGLLALVGMTALLAGVWYMGRESAPAVSADAATGPMAASIAVLPFADMSPNKDQEYFSDGISEELLNLLANVPELHVAARTSSFSFKGENLEIPEIAERLKVAHVLEGSVRKAGSEVRITAQLIRAEDGYHVWSQTWDRTLEDIFAVQDEIAADVVDQLRVTLLGEAPHTTETDPEAYALFLQARQLNRQGSAEGYERSSEMLQQALAIDPEYAMAWALLARNRRFQAGQGLRPLDEGYRLAREAANRALAIDPEYAPAYALLSRIASDYDHDLAAAARYLKRALELEPTDTDILNDAASLANSLGRLDDAIALLEAALERDPVNSQLHFYLGVSYRWAGRGAEAISQHRTALDLSPDRMIAHYGIGMALLGMGEPEAALEEIRQEPEEGGWELIGLPMIYHALGRGTESDSALAELIEKWERDSAYNIAYVYAYRNEADHAFEWLQKAVEYNDPGLSQIMDENLFANIRDDPRWLPFLESIGKSPAQLAAIDFEVTLP